jgi:hypothetical protein
VALSVSTLQDNFDLDLLNSGNGVRLGVVRITNRLGQTGTVDLSSAETVGDVKALLNAAVDDETGEALNVEVKTGVGVAGVAGLSVEDKTEPPEDSTQELIIEDVSGFAARDLGIAARTASNTFSGQRGVSHHHHRRRGSGDQLCRRQRRQGHRIAHRKRHPVGGQHSRSQHVHRDGHGQCSRSGNPRPPTTWGSRARL